MDIISVAPNGACRWTCDPLMITPNLAGMQAHLQTNVTTSSPASAASRRIAIAILLFLALASPMLFLHLMNLEIPSFHNDLIGRWVGTRAALQGRDPYSPEVLNEIQRAYYGRPLTPADHVPDQAFNYPAHLVLLLAPFSWLSWESFRLLFLGCSIPLMILSFLCSIRLLHLPVTPSQEVSLILLSLFSWPAIWGLRLLQPTVLVFVFMILGCWLLSRTHYVSAGVFLALATVKPQVVAPLLLWLLVWACYHRAWKFLMSLLFTGGLLFLLTCAVVPHWISHWLTALRTFQSVYGVLPLEYVLGHWPGRVATLLLGAWTGLQMLRGLRYSSGDPQFGFCVALALAATLCANFTILAMIYNQILLVPASLLLVCAKPLTTEWSALARRLALASLQWEFASVPLALLIRAFFGSSSIWMKLPFLNILLPVLVTVALLLDAKRILAINSKTVKPAPLAFQSAVA